MKFLKNNSIVVILFSSVVIILMILNLVLDLHPVLDFVRFLENKKYFWTIPITVIMLCCLWLFDRSMRKKIINERVEIFNATIHTLQDILHKSSSSMQLLILDMKDEGVNEEIIERVEDNLEELHTIAKALSAIDPKSMQLKELNRNLSIIKMHEHS